MVVGFGFKFRSSRYFFKFDSAVSAIKRVLQGSVLFEFLNNLKELQGRRELISLSIEVRSGVETLWFLGLLAIFETIVLSPKLMLTVGNDFLFKTYLVKQDTKR